MKSNPNGDAPAFPIVITEGPGVRHTVMPGLTKRELFAVLIYACAEGDGVSAQNAINCADTMIELLNQEPKGK